MQAAPAGARRETLRHGGEDRHHQRAGCDREPGLERGPAPHVLEPEHGAEQPGSEGEGEQHRSGVGPGERAHAQQCGLDDRQWVAFRAYPESDEAQRRDDQQSGDAR